MKTHSHPQKTNMHHARTIHRQGFDGCPSYDRFAKGASAIVTPAEMLVPALPSRVKQSYAPACLRVPRRDLRTLCVVTHWARVAQVVRLGLSTQRPRHDVIDFEGFGAESLLQLTVFTAELSSLGDELSKRLRDVCRGAIAEVPVADTP